MTRKHFSLLAAAFKTAKPSHNATLQEHLQWENDCEAIAYACAQDNPRFNKIRFLTACGLGRE